MHRSAATTTTETVSRHSWMTPSTTATATAARFQHSSSSSNDNVIDNNNDNDDSTPSSTITDIDSSVLSGLGGLPVDHQRRAVRILRPGSNAMQSASDSMKSALEQRSWRVEFLKREQRSDNWAEPLMGWTAGSDPMQRGVHMSFGSLEAAVHYCDRNGFQYTVEQPTEERTDRQGKSYSENFRRRGYTPSHEDPWEV